MRMITHDSACHNAPASCRTPFRWSVLVLLLLAISSCSEDKGTEEKASPQATHSVADCGLTTDSSAWTAFKEVADRINAGTIMTKEELDAFGDLPPVALWRDSYQSDYLTAQRVGNWLEGTFWEELGRKGEQKYNSNRKDFISSYHYSLDNRDRIDERLAELTGPRKCDLTEIARFWIEPDLMPRILAIHFLPAKMDMRIFGDNLLVDTGIVSATRVDQIIRQMAALLYRNFQSVPGPNPTKQEGAEALAHSFRILMNKGISGWIEKSINLEYDRKNPFMLNFSVVPENFFAMTQKMIKTMNSQLGPMLDDEDKMNENGQELASHLAVSGGFDEGSYGMAAVISARLGEDKLRQAGRSVPAFLAAFQEAALANPVPAPQPGDPGTELFQTVPPLDPEIFTKLHAMLTEVFPD